jgi:hypothetical protein
MFRTVFAESERAAFVFRWVPAGLQETVPFPPEVQRRDSLQRHLQKLLGEIARLLAIPLYRLRRELFLRVLLEELFQERPEGLR